MWVRHRDQLPPGASVVLLNSEHVDSASNAALFHTQGDARDLSRYADGEFDVCFSSSLIEHFPSLHEQQTVAREIRRVARSYFVQTPNRYFPLEPHFLFPGWQFMPLPVRTALLQRRRFGWMPRAENESQARDAVTRIRLLTRREMGELFPDAVVTPERFGPPVRVNDFETLRDGV